MTKRSLAMKSTITTYLNLQDRLATTLMALLVAPNHVTRSAVHLHSAPFSAPVEVICTSHHLTFTFGSAKMESGVLLTQFRIVSVRQVIDVFLLFVANESRQRTRKKAKTRMRKNYQTTDLFQFLTETIFHLRTLISILYQIIIISFQEITEIVLKIVDFCPRQDMYIKITQQARLKYYSFHLIVGKEAFFTFGNGQKFYDMTEFSKN